MAKGILIICVVIGHAINFEYLPTAVIKTIICTFHIPGFFIISGILMKREKLKKQSLRNFAKHKIKRLLLPYLVFEIIGAILQMVLYGIDKVTPIDVLYGILTLHCYNGVDWFLPTLFFAEIIFFILLKKFKTRQMFLIAICTFILAYFVCDWNYGIAVIRRILVAFCFVVIGCTFKQLFVKKTRFCMLLAFVGLVGISYVNGVVDLSARTFNNPILYLIGGMVGTYFVLSFSQYFTGILEKCLAKAGRESLVIMGTHMYIILILNEICGNMYSINMQLILLTIIIIYEIILLAIYTAFSKRYQNRKIMKTDKNL